MTHPQQVGFDANGHPVDAMGLVLVDGMTGEEMDAQHRAFANPSGINGSKGKGVLTGKQVAARKGQISGQTRAKTGMGKLPPIFRK